MIIAKKNEDVSIDEDENDKLPNKKRKWQAWITIVWIQIEQPRKWLISASEYHYMLFTLIDMIKS